MTSPGVAAVILAAGQSRRMGQPKMALPWGSTTVIGQIVRTLRLAGLSEIVVVTGAWPAAVQVALVDQPIRLVHNPHYQEDEMVFSVQAGLAALSASTQAALVTLGDQPQLQVDCVQAVLQAFAGQAEALIVPSYRFRRGHPWLLGRALWPEILNLPPGGTLRTWLNAHADQIQYVNVDNDSILRDLDTPQDYEEQKP